MIAAAVRTTIAFRAVLIAVTMGMSTWGFASRGSEPGRIPIVNPPPRFAPLHGASITPFSPPHARTASARAMRNPTSSASAFASALAVFEPPITEMMGFRSSMASFSRPIPRIKLFDPWLSPPILSREPIRPCRRLSRTDALDPQAGADPVHDDRGTAVERGALPDLPTAEALRGHPPGGPGQHGRPVHEGHLPREDPGVPPRPPVLGPGRGPRAGLPRAVAGEGDDPREARRGRPRGRVPPPSDERGRVGLSGSGASQ